MHQDKIIRAVTFVNRYYIRSQIICGYLFRGTLLDQVSHSVAVIFFPHCLCQADEYSVADTLTIPH